MSNEQISNLVDKDKPILLGAIAQKCDYLLTSDKKDFGHFMAGKVFMDNLLIGTPAMLANLLGLKKT